jgi:hypothetical protein
MPAEIDAVKLQLAMAFGQGAGTMLATAEALETLLAEEGEILVNAMGSWSASRWAFTELVRTLGQLSAAHAAAAGSAEIRWTDIAPSIAGVLSLCPCFDVGGRSRRPSAGR